MQKSKDSLKDCFENVNIRLRDQYLAIAFFSFSRNKGITQFVRYMTVKLLNDCPWADLEGRQGDPLPLKNHKNIGFPCNTGPDLLNTHKATKPAFNVGPSSARQRHDIYSALWTLYLIIN